MPSPQSAPQAADADAFAALRPIFAGRTVLLLEDDPALADHVAARLTAAGFSGVEVVQTGEAALARGEARGYDLLILDRMTPGLDGLETLKRLRAGSGPSASAPVLMLTALGGERQKVEGLLSGADDYLAKPVGDEELIARIAAQLRRAAPPPSGEIVNGPFRLSPGARTLAFRPPGGGDARLIDLSPLEFSIICDLMSAPGQPVTKTMLWERCWVEWKFLPDNYVNIIDARISALRRRLRAHSPELTQGLHPLIVSARSQSLVFRDLDGVG